MAASPSCPQRTGVRALARGGWRAALATLAILAAAGGVRAAEPVRGDVRVATENGFARLVFKLDETVVANVRLNWPIVIITFRRPVNVSVERLNAGAPDYISAARIDPDGSAIRIALARKVKLNTIAAAERLYVDLLPEDWAGVLPGLPQVVIEDPRGAALPISGVIVDVSHDGGGAQTLSQPVAARIADASPQPAAAEASKTVPVIAPAEAVPAAQQTVAPDDGLPPLIDVPAP